MSQTKPYTVMFLCSGNSGRSIMAEYLMKIVAPGKFESFSAGAEPKDAVHPLTLKVLSEIHRLDVSGARSKSWDEFKGIEFDFVITVCDKARETCPYWPGQPVQAHWGSVDPVAVEGSEEQKLKAFKDVSFEIRRRIEIFSSLPFEKLDHFRLQELTAKIGQRGCEADVEAEAKKISESE